MMRSVCDNERIREKRIFFDIFSLILSFNNLIDSSLL